MEIARGAQSREDELESRVTQTIGKEVDRRVEEGTWDVQYLYLFQKNGYLI